jgi:hypothetical protein
MKTFTDNAGRTWTIVLTVNEVKRVKTLLPGVDLVANAADGTLFDRLGSDLVFMCDVVYAVVKPQADAQKVTDEDFGRAMAGDCLEKAAMALVEALLDFFPEAKRRLLAKILAKLRSFQTTVRDRAMAELDSPELDKKFQAEIDAILARGKASTSLPASPGSTPAP